MKISFLLNILFYISIALIIILLYMYDDEQDKNEDEKNIKKYFATFGDTKSRYNNSRMRIVSEARDLNYFDDIFEYSEKKS